MMTQDEFIRTVIAVGVAAIAKEILGWGMRTAKAHGLIAARSVRAFVTAHWQVIEFSLDAGFLAFWTIMFFTPVGDSVSHSELRFQLILALGIVVNARHMLRSLGAWLSAALGRSSGPAGRQAGRTTETDSTAEAKSTQHVLDRETRHDEN